MKLYENLIENIEVDSYKRLYNIAKTKIPLTDEKYFDSDWYTKHIQKPLRDFLYNQSIVEIENSDNKALSEIWFPIKSYSKEIREKLWQFTFDLFPNSVCKRDHLHYWIDIVWEDINKITYAEIVNDIANKKNLSKLSDDLNLEENLAIEWLNEVGKYIMSDENNLPLFEKTTAIPDKNGVFKIRSELFIDKIKDSQLVEVLQLLGEDWNDLLLHQKISFGKYQKKEKEDIARKIIERLKVTSNKNENFIKAISLLSEWFDANPEEGGEFFTETYKKRAELFMNTIEDKDSLYKVMRSKTNLSHLSKVAAAIEENPRLYENIEQANELFTVLKQYNIHDLQGLHDLLNGLDNSHGHSKLLPVTEGILTNMGISSFAEWEEAIKDKDIAALFSHESTPTTDMFVYVQSMIKQAKEKIIEYLSTLSNYNLDDLDATTAPTILAGIFKDGMPISIVARPAYNGEVIIYYGSERDILDFEPSELWIDDGAKPKKISLGHLLKKAGIVKFPI